MEGAANDSDLEFGEVGQRLFEKGAARFSNRRVGGRQVSVRGRAQPGCDRDAVVASGTADFGDMLGAITIEVMRGDFDNVETQLCDFLDVFEAVGAPLLLPVRIVNSEFQLRLRISCVRSALSASARPSRVGRAGRKAVAIRAE